MKAAVEALVIDHLKHLLRTGQIALAHLGWLMLQVLSLCNPNSDFSFEVTFDATKPDSQSKPIHLPGRRMPQLTKPKAHPGHLTASLADRASLPRSRPRHTCCRPRRKGGSAISATAIARPATETAAITRAGP